MRPGRAERAAPARSLPWRDNGVGAAYNVIMRVHIALGIVLCLSGCKSADAPVAKAAAIAVGAAVVAAAIDRAAPGDCWGSCRPGTYCDSSSGLCVAAPR